VVLKSNKAMAGGVKPVALRIIFSSRFGQYAYFSLSLTVRNRFKRIFLFLPQAGSREMIRVSVYDRGLRKRLVMALPARSVHLIFAMFKDSNYLLYGAEIAEILSERFSVRHPNILDLGANVASFSIVYYHFLSFYLKTKPYLCLFEPLDFNVKLIEMNLKENNIQQYRIYQNAVCDKSGEYVNFYTGGSTTGATIMEKTKYTAEQATHSVKVRSLKVDDLGLSDVGVIKIDVEGAEELAIQGMKQTISANHPVILCSYEHDTNDKGKIVRYVTSCAEYVYKDDERNKLLYFLPKTRV
jgi:FkbM family methyltransferase